MTADFYQRMVDEWEAKLKQASEQGDYDAWQHAEREVENYKMMLERLKC